MTDSKSEYQRTLLLLLSAALMLIDSSTETYCPGERALSFGGIVAKHQFHPSQKLSYPEILRVE
jgi:hypothetical protein